MKRSFGPRDETPPQPITFRAASDLNAFELAELWADRLAWPLDERSQYDELAELAVMSALATRLGQWQPIAIHSAILAGASPGSVAGAFGDTVQATFDCWHEWALDQRDFILNGKPGITATEYNTVASRLAAAGLEMPS